jgi:hypothetical protein
MRLTGVRTSSRAKRLHESLVPKLAALANENDAHAFGHLDQDERTFLRATLKVSAMSRRSRHPEGRERAYRSRSFARAGLAHRVATGT